MTSSRESPIAIVIGVALFSTGFWPIAARGDGGTLRAWKQFGECDVAVFTEPSPFVVGPVDVSVLLLDRNTGEPIEEARIVVEIWPKGRPALALRHPATRQAATNKLLYAADFELRDVGRYEAIVSIDGPSDPAKIQFELDVGSPWSLGTGVWPWILWPAPVIVCYCIHRRLVDKVARRSRKTQEQAGNHFPKTRHRQAP
jgi:hypothetical protein